MGKPNTVVNIDFFRLDDINWIVVDLKDDVADVHHWGSMCYTLGHISVLVTILDEKEEIRYDAV